MLKKILLRKPQHSWDKTQQRAQEIEPSYRPPFSSQRYTLRTPVPHANRVSADHTLSIELEGSIVPSDIDGFSLPNAGQSPTSLQFEIDQPTTQSTPWLQCPGGESSGLPNPRHRPPTPRPRHSALTVDWSPSKAAPGSDRYTWSDPPCRPPTLASSGTTHSRKVQSHVSVTQPASPHSDASPLRVSCQLCQQDMNVSIVAANLEGLKGQVVGLCEGCLDSGLDLSGISGLKTSAFPPSQRDLPQQGPLIAPVPLSPIKRMQLRRFGINQAASTTPAIPAPSTISARIQPESSVKQTHLCSICSTDYPHDHFLLPTSDCVHEADYCRGCMQRMIATDLESRGWDKIRCPDTKCKKRLSDADVLRHAPGATYERYSDLSIKTVLSILPDFHRCLNTSCSSGQIHTNADGPLFICHVCGYKVCMHHKIPWHDGDTCKEYDYRIDGTLKRKEERASEATKRRTTRPCPNCKAPIEKNNGCDHMKCLNVNCNHEFCWECRVDYDPIRRGTNALHASNCKFFAE